MKYHYDKAIHWQKPEKKKITITRWLGIIFLFTGLLSLVHYQESKMFSNILHIIMFLLGGYQAFYPEKSMRPLTKIKEGKHFVKINEEKIEWKLDGTNMSINLNDVKHYTEYVGEIHFTTKNGETKILESNKITDMGKFIELNQVLRQNIEVSPYQVKYSKSK